MTETSIRRLFERYQQLFERALSGEADMDEVTSVYVYCDRLFRFGGAPSADQSANLKQIRELLLAGRAW